MSRIVSLGAALQDIYLVDHDDLVSSEVGGRAILGKVTPGTKVDIDRLEYHVGGGGLNSAVTFARNGHEAILMANIAHDAAGEAILTKLDEEEIDSSYMEFADRGGTGSSVILLDSKSGERTVLTYRGASTNFRNFDEKDLELLQPDWLYVTTTHGDMGTLRRFFEKAHEMGIKVMFNPGKGELREKQKLLGLLEDVTVLLVNKEEAREMVPGELLTELAYRLGNYVPVALVTDGGMGGIGVNGREAYRFGIYEDVKTRDVTGAGDAFGAGFLSAYAEGRKFREALIYGAANSTGVIQQLGANEGIVELGADLHPMPIQEVQM